MRGASGCGESFVWITERPRVRVVVTTNCTTLASRG